MSTTVTQPYARRRDPADPWRWRCPECSAPRVNRRATQADPDRYECGRCGWYGLVDELEDAREGAT
jgi:ribosomal protein S27AE